MERLLITGATGMVGSRFVELYGHKYELLTPSRAELDIPDIDSVARLKKQFKPDAFINLAGFTDVTEGEKQRNKKTEECWGVNVDGVENLWSVFNDTYGIQVSTDMIFSGTQDNPGPYQEYQVGETNPDKLTWYGYTKSAAENYLRNSHDDYSIVRIMYPVRVSYDRKLDYIRKPLSLFDQGKLYPMFDDQQISISYIDEVCAVFDRLITTRQQGTFHASSRNTTTPYELISMVIEKVRGVNNAVQRSSLDEFLKKVDNPVRYPKCSGLSVEVTSEGCGTIFSTTEEIADKLIAQGLGS